MHDGKTCRICGGKGTERFHDFFSGTTDEECRACEGTGGPDLWHEAAVVIRDIRAYIPGNRMAREQAEWAVRQQAIERASAWRGLRADDSHAWIDASLHALGVARPHRAVGV